MNLILQQISKKNEPVFKTLFNTHFEKLVVYANEYLYDKDASQDLVQEIFIYIWEHANELNIETSLNGYLYAMTRNRCLNYLKSLKITDNYAIIELNANLMADIDIENTSEEDKQIVYYQLLKIIDNLPDKMQQIVKLKFLKEYSYIEIANELDISVNTVKTQLKRGKLKIAEMATLFLVLLEIKH